MNTFTEKIEIGGKTLTLEYGKLAEQANGAVLVQYGETVVLVTVVMSSQDTDKDYLPLFVEFAEKLYAGGRIKGSRWVKREGRPSDEAILKARIIDRSIRPLFSKDLKKEVQVIATVLSADSENDADIPALIGASAAIHISDIPWDGPVAAVRIGKNDEYLVNPTYKQREDSKMDLIASGSEEAIVMVEAGANEVTEEETLSALKLAHKEIKKTIKAIKSLRQKAGKEKQTLVKKEQESPELVKEIAKKAKKQLEPQIGSPFMPRETMRSITDALAEEYQEDLTSDKIFEVVDNTFKDLARTKTIEEGVRFDGRSLEEVREISSEVGILPRTHGSAIFKRGKTQSLTIATLGAPSLRKHFESMEGEGSKRYIHHYYMPPYTVGETGRVGWPSRREIGHGALAERALLPVIPKEEDFPYTIHVVSQIMSSNGSTSQAAVCGSTLSLMEAGVPIKKPVAGIAMGLMTDGKNHAILTDIAGTEDFIGDMDFKIAGTREGINAIQMDIKVSGISFEVLEKALEQARVGRLSILEDMLKPLDQPRTQLSKYAPKIKQIEIPKDKIGEVIGPGGKTIRKLIEETGAEIDVEDDEEIGKGIVTISSENQDSINDAAERIQNMIKEPEAGEIYTGTVKRIEDYGAFIEILPGKSGLVHISEMAEGYVKDPKKHVKLDEKVEVKVVGIDDKGRINLSMVK